MEIINILSFYLTIILNFFRSYFTLVLFSPFPSGHESKILKAMASFSLPTENVPEWARNLSDDQWKLSVLRKIKSEEKRVATTTKRNEGHACEMTVKDSEPTSGHQAPRESTSQSYSTEPNSDWVACFPDTDT